MLPFVLGIFAFVAAIFCAGVFIHGATRGHDQREIIGIQSESTRSRTT